MKITHEYDQSEIEDIIFNHVKKKYWSEFQLEKSDCSFRFTLDNNRTLKTICLDFEADSVFSKSKEDPREKFSGDCYR